MDHALDNQLNVIGTFQWNRFGGTDKTGRRLTPKERKAGLRSAPFDVDDLKKTLKLRTHETMFAQREDNKITLSVWADNNYVRVASNVHGVQVELDGVMRRKLGADGTRDKSKTKVDAPSGTVAYQRTFNKIDQFNKEALAFPMWGKSMVHNWAPKIVFALFACNLENAFLVYRSLGGNDDRRTCRIKLAHRLMQAGPDVRQRPPTHPPPSTSLKERTKRRRMRGNIAPSPDTAVSQQTRSRTSSPANKQTPAAQASPVTDPPSRPLHAMLKTSPRRAQAKYAASRRKQGQWWRRHQSKYMGKQKSCDYEECPSTPGRQKRGERAQTRYICEECTERVGVLCTTATRKGGTATARQTMGTMAPGSCSPDVRLRMINDEMTDLQSF
jgi:hypothetical protein